MPKDLLALAEAERRACNRVDAWVADAVAVGWIPGNTITAAVDVEICSEVAACFAVEYWTVEAVSAAVGATMAEKITVREPLPLMLAFGWVIKSGLTRAITQEVGKAIVDYFKSCSPYNIENFQTS